MADVYPLPTARYAGRLIIELDPLHNWAGNPNVILAADGSAWIDYARLPVQGGGTENRILSVEVSDGADHAVRTMRATLMMVTGNGSVSSGAVDSYLNTLSGSYRPAIFGGRRILFQEPLGDPASTNPAHWRPIFWGHIDEHPANHEGRVQIFARDTSALLMTPYTGDPVWIGTEGQLVPLNEAVQAVLDAATDDGDWVVHTPDSDLEWAIPAFQLTETPDVLQYIRDMAQQRGAVVRWWYHSGTGRFQLTLFVLQKETAVTHTFPINVTKDIPAQGSDTANYRNDFTLRYVDSGGEVQTIRRPATPQEIKAFGRRTLLIAEGGTSHINTLAEAEVMLDSVEAALRIPAVTGSRELPYTPTIEVNSRLSLAADSRVATEAQSLYVVNFNHRITAAGNRFKSSTRVDLRGAPVGQLARWLRSFTGEGASDTELATTLDLIYRGSDGGIRHYEVVTHNAPAEVETWVYWKIFDSPIDEDWLETLIQPANRHTVLEDGGSGEFTTAQPPAGTILKGIVVAMRPTDDGYTVVGDGVEFEADGSEAPIHVGEPKFTENPAGTHSTFSVTIGDPRGVVTGVDVFLSVGASASGPHAATKSGDAYSYQFALDHDHVTIVRARINRDDGGEPIWLGPYTADTDKIPDIPDVAITWVADDAYVQVDCEDTDAVSLWRQKVVDGVPGTEVQIPARGADPRFGSFTETHVTEEVRYRVYAKNSAGTAGEYRDVRIVPPQLAQFLATHARITDATATTITVTVDADPDTAEVELLDDTTATRTSGPNVGVKSPSGTVWVFARPAAGSGPRMAWFRSTLADHVSDDDGVVIPEIGQGVVPLIVRARVTASSSNSMTVQVRVADPTPQNNITLSYVAQDVVGINPGSPQTILAANVTSNLDTTGFVTFAVPRPPVGASDGSISFTATSTGRIADVDSVTIPAQVPPVMRVDTAEDQAHPSGPRGIVTLSPLPGAVYDSVQFASQAGNANPSSWGSGNLGALSHYVPLHSKHASAIGYRVQRSGVVVQQDWVRGFDVGEVAEVLTIDVRESGTGTVAIVFECDTDTAIGSGNVRFRLDGGPTYTALTVNAQRLASTLEIGGISQSTMGAREIAVQARNKHGAWGPEKIGSIPVYVEAAAPTGVITEALLANVSQGFCGAPDQQPPLPAVPIKNEVTWKVSGTVPPGTQIYVERWFDEAGGVVAGGPFPFANGSFTEEIHGYRLGAGPGEEHRIQFRVLTNNDTIPVAWTNTIRQKWVLCS